MIRLTCKYSLFTLLMLPGVSVAANNSSLATGPDGSIIARDASGVSLWRRYNVTASGTARRDATSARATPSSVTMPTWDPLTLLDSDPIYSAIAGPIFDSLGNAWVVINDPDNLIAIQSNGVSGTWQAPHIIGPSLPTEIGTVGLAVDQAGGFYVTYGTAATAGATSNPLMLTKYTPAMGWLPAIQIYNSPSYFSLTSPVVDAAGRLVVVFNASGISSIASNPPQSSWGAVQTISPATDNPLLPSVAANKSGTRLALVYLLSARGLRYTFFNSTTGQWNKSTAVPNSGKATFASDAALDVLPVAVDESGNVTVASTVRATSNNDLTDSARSTLYYSIGGFRYEGGRWTMQQLVAPSASLPSLESFGSIALNASGAVLISVPLYDGFEGTNITVFRYTPGVGWDTEIAAHYNMTTVSRCKVAWFEGTEAVVVYAPGGPLQAALYANGTWGSGPPIPGNLTYVPFQALAGAPAGEDLLVMPDNGVYATFLRP